MKNILVFQKNKSYTIHDNKVKIIEEIKKITKDPVPCISFFKIDHANDEFINWIGENVNSSWN